MTLNSQVSDITITVGILTGEQGFGVTLWMRVRGLSIVMFPIVVSVSRTTQSFSIIL